VRFVGVFSLLNFFLPFLAAELTRIIHLSMISVVFVDKVLRFGGQ
jgi:hypothetical protein